MNKQHYLMAMHRLYREVYAAHGEKDVYSFKDGLIVVEAFLAKFPDVFGVNKDLFCAQMPTFGVNSRSLIRNGMRIDHLLLNVSLLALKESKMVTCSFIKVLLWSLSGPLELAPK